jgi:uncharacterized protein YcbK (DUF882 family)
MKRLIRYLLLSLVILLLVFFCYCNNLCLADKRTVSLYNALKKELLNRGYRPRLLVISTKRIALHNKLQVQFSGAAPQSRHLKGEAIDFLVFDINRDGKADDKDVDIVVDLLENNIMQGRGGVGTYKNEATFINRQMVHIDCREKKARWAR